MNRRDFIKTAGASTALATWTVTCKYEEEGHKGDKGEKGEAGVKWDYRVYCYERGQGEWLFSQNIRGSFAEQREYMTFEEEDLGRWGDMSLPYCGWMDRGKLHFPTFDDATDFVDMHVRAKDDTNLIDSIYDVYFVRRGLPIYDDAEQIVGTEQDTEIKVAHYWFNGDTGRTIIWEQDGFNTDWGKIESS